MDGKLNPKVLIFDLNFDLYIYRGSSGIASHADLNVTFWFKALIYIWILSFMNKIAWVIESVRDLAIYLNIQQYTTVNTRRDNIWFNCVQAISGIFIIIK